MKKLNLLLKSCVTPFLFGTCLSSYAQLQIEASLKDKSDLSMQYRNAEPSQPLQILEDERDSLFFKRGFVSGKILQKKVVIANKIVMELFKSDKKLARKYTIGRIIRPVGSVVALGGIALSYTAIQGKTASRSFEGENYNYTVRSLPTLLAGIGAVVGGICLIEFSNELISNTTGVYNSKLGSKKVSFKEIKLEISPAGSVGLFVKF